MYVSTWYRVKTELQEELRCAIEFSAIYRNNNKVTGKTALALAVAGRARLHQAENTAHILIRKPANTHSQGYIRLNRSRPVVNICIERERVRG